MVTGTEFQKWLSGISETGYDSKRISNGSHLFKNIKGVAVYGNNKAPNDVKTLVNKSANKKDLSYNGKGTIYGAYDTKNNIVYVISSGTIHPNEDASSMFEGFSVVESITFKGINTQQVTNMSRMFMNCLALTSLDLSGFKTQKVTDMSSMFSYCNNLAKLNITISIRVMLLTSAECFLGAGFFPI